MNIECLPAKNGEHTLRISLENQSPFFLHSTYNPSREAAQRINARAITPDQVVVLAGLGLGYELKEILEHVHADQRVVVIEKSPEIFNLFNKQERNDTLRNHPQITFCIKQSLEEIGHTLASGGNYCLILSHAQERLFPAYYAALRDYVQPKTDRALTGILLIGRGIVAPYIVQDVAFALRNLNCNVHLMPLKYEFDGAEEEAAALKPDFVFALDGNGLDFPWIRSLSCRKIAWFVDNPFYFLDKANDDTLYFSWDEAYIPSMKERGARNVFFMPLATNPDIFKPQTLSPAELERYACAVSFVGSISDIKPESILKKRNERFGTLLTDEINSALDDIIKLQMKNALSGRVRTCHELVGKSQNVVDERTKMAIDQHVDYELSDHLRAHIVKALQSFNTQLYGNEILKQLSTDTCRFMGRIDYHAALPKLFSACDININVSRPQLLTTVNQRIYDISATRSFFLTDYKSILNSLFPVDPSSISYRSFSELHDKITYYLNHPDERNEIARILYSTTITQHTYTVRMKNMLNILHKYL